jgi:hypothetical protein
MPKIGRDNIMGIAILVLHDPKATADEKDEAERYLDSIDQDFVESLRTVMWKNGLLTKSFGTGHIRLAMAGESLLAKARIAGFEFFPVEVHVNGEKVGYAENLEVKS